MKTLSEAKPLLRLTELRAELTAQLNAAHVPPGDLDERIRKVLLFWEAHREEER